MKFRGAIEADEKGRKKWKEDPRRRTEVGKLLSVERQKGNERYKREVEKIK